MDQFEYILAVAEERNLTKAAERMFISQPAMTLRIKRLEEELGIRIFDRSKIPLEITPEGEIYLTEMKKIKTMEENLFYRLLTSRHTASRQLVLGIGINRGRALLPVLLPALSALHPQLSFQTREGSDSETESLIKNGSVDIGILSTPIVSQELYVSPLSTEEVFLAVPRDHPVLTGRDVSDNSPEHPCILPPECLNGQQFILGQLGYGLTRYGNYVFSLHHIKPCSTLNIGNSETAYWLAGAGMGIAFTLKEYAINSFFRGSIPRPILCTIENTPLKRTLSMVCKASRKDDDMIQMTMARITEILVPG